MNSVCPTFKGFTPVGIIISGAAATLIVSGVARVGICEVESTGPNQCEAAWDGLADNAKAAGFGVTGLFAQSPFAELMKRKNEGPPMDILVAESEAEEIPPPPVVPMDEMMDGGTLPPPGEIESVSPPTSLPQKRRVVRRTAK